MARRPASKARRRRPETAAPLLAGRRGARTGQVRKARRKGPGGGRRLHVCRLGAWRQGWVGDGGAGKASHRKSGGASDRSPAKSDSRVKRTQSINSRLPTTGFRPCGDRDVNKVVGQGCRQDRIFAKPLDDSGLWRGFEFSCRDRSSPLQIGGGWVRRGGQRGVRFCARRSDFKGLSFFFCNSNRVGRAASRD